MAASHQVVTVEGELSGIPPWTVLVVAAKVAVPRENNGLKIKENSIRATSPMSARSMLRDAAMKAR
jgi:hypothetical protein